MVSFKNVSSVGGNGIIPLNWDDDVPKYDPSSFYNWEQDNVPLWVIEQRGDTLYRAMGYPGGNPEGVTFVLSSTGHVDEGKGIYDSIDDIVERIPKRLKFPVLIEICRYGELGNLDLANITCEGEGKLEVVNRAYFEDTNASANAVADIGGSPADAALGNRMYVKQLYSPIASGTQLNVSSTRLQTSFADYDSWNKNTRLFAYQGPDTDRQANNITFYSASSTGTTRSMNGGAPFGNFSIPHPYDYTNDWGAGADTATAGTAASSWGDATPWYGSSTADYMILKRQEQYTKGQCAFFGYGAYFSSISLKDCQGTVILRNLLVDAGNLNGADYRGAGAAVCQRHRGEYGFDIENSEVILDNVASVRNATGGFRATNSRVKITGHCVAYRNYTKTGRAPANRNQDGVGFYALNSDLEWDGTKYTDSRKYLNYFGKSKRGIDLRNTTVRGGINYAGAATSGLPNAGSQLLSQPLRSESAGGVTVTYGQCSGAGGDTYTTTVNISDCNEHGFYAEGSDIDFAGRINSFLNVGDGMRLSRSQAQLPQFTLNNNSGWGLHLIGSQLTYAVSSENFAVRPDGYSQITGTQSGGGATPAVRIPNGAIPSNDFTAGVPAAANTRRIRNRAQFHVDSNNQNILIDKSSAANPASINNIPLYVGQFGGCEWTHTNAPSSIGTNVKYLPATHFGATPFRANNKPGIVVTNNSDAELVGVNYAVLSQDTGKGKVAIASNGSNLIFRGTSSTCTTFNYYPVNSVERQFRSWLSAGVVASNNSNVELTGPTKSARFGVPFLAEGNSNLKIKPPTLVGTDNILDISGYNLIPYQTGGEQLNHTRFEVHASRACLVANKNSNIQMYALGGQALRGKGASPNKGFIDSVDVLTTSYADAYLGDQNNQFDQSTSAGYVKMYPNAFTSGVASIAAFAPRLSLDVTEAQNESFNSTNSYVRTPDTNASDDYHRTAMTGGMCVRAVQDSTVDVNLVNFKFQGAPSSVSGAYYNLSGKGCEHAEDKIPDVGPPTTDNSYTVEETPSAREAGTALGIDDDTGLGEGGGTGTGSNSDFETVLIVGGTGGSYTESDGNATNQGTMYTVAGQGTDETLFATFGSDSNDQAGSMTVLGDERSAVRCQRYRAYMRSKSGATINAPDGFLMPSYKCMGSQIQIWNIADTSRIHAANILANGMDPMTWSLSAGAPGGGSNCHGPTGKWRNGVSLDYYGLAGRRTTYGGCGAVFANTGVFRLMMSTRGDLKSFYDVSTLSGTSTGTNGWQNNASYGGSPVDQVNGQGYTHWTQNVRVLGAADNVRRLTGTDSDFPQGIYQLSSCLRVFGWGMPSMDPSAGVATMQPRIGGFSAYNAVSGIGGQPSGAYFYTTAEPVTPMAPVGMDYYGFMRNWLDESAAGMFQNAKHMAEDKVNGLSIYRSHMGGATGGEGRDADAGGADAGSFGVGVRSLNVFDLERLV